MGWAQILLPLAIGAACFVSVLLLMTVFSKPTEKKMDNWLTNYAKSLSDEFELLQLPFTPIQFIYAQLGLTMALFAVGLVTGPDPISKLVVGACFGFLGFVLARRFISEQHKKRTQKFQGQFADAAALIGNSVRSGLSLYQALEILVREMDDPIAYEVYQVLQATRVGAPLDQVLEDWAKRMNNPDLDIFVTAINIQRQTGGDLGHVLHTLATTIRERNKIQGQILALTAQGRLGAYVLGGLPLFMGIVLYFINPGRMSLMLTHPIGWGMIAISTVTIFMGVFIIRKIVDIDI